MWKVLFHDMKDLWFPRCFGCLLIVGKSPGYLFQNAVNPSMGRSVFAFLGKQGLKWVTWTLCLWAKKTALEVPFSYCEIDVLE